MEEEGGAAVGPRRLRMPRVVCGSCSKARSATGDVRAAQWPGDSVLKSLASHHVFHASRPSEAPLLLNRHRARLCSNRHLSLVGERMGLAILC